MIRSLIDEIIVQPEKENYRLEIKGDLARILHLAGQNHKSPLNEGANVQLMFGCGSWI